MVKPPVDFVEFFTEYQGELYWKVDKAPCYKKGDKAGSIDSKGYKRVGLLRREYLVHRIIYFLYTNSWPRIVDHKDGNPLNNDIKNLRAADFFTNASNSKVPKNSSTNILGVGFHKQSKKFCARVSLKTGRKFLGLFETKEEAQKVVDEFMKTQGVGRVGAT